MSLPDILAWAGASVTVLTFAFASRNVLTSWHPADAGLSAPQH